MTKKRFALGNSLTDDCGVQFITGMDYHLRGGESITGFYADPDEGETDTFNPYRWSEAFTTNQYDYIGVQPYNETKTGLIAALESMLAAQPNAIIVLHDSTFPFGSWDTYWNTALADGTNGKANQDDIRRLIGESFPNQRIRETNVADIFNDIIEDGVIPIEDLHRDGTHWSFDISRCIGHNAYRAAMRLPYLTLAQWNALATANPSSFATVTAEQHAYIIQMVNARTPGFYAYTGD